MPRAREVVASHPQHVVLRVTREVGNLRRRHAYRAIRGAFAKCAARADYRVVHVSIQATNVHLLVEADDTRALARGMQGFAISAAKRLNRELRRRRGDVFAFRDHATAITTPTLAEHAARRRRRYHRRVGDELDELAARGRAALERERREREEASRRAARDTELRALISTTPIGAARTVTGALIVGAIAAVVGTVCLVFPAVADNPSPTAGAMAQIFAAIALPIVAIVVARRMAVAAGRATYPRALAWANALPFEVHGLADALAADPEPTLVVTIELAQPADLDRIAQAVVGLGRRHLRASVAGDRVRITQGALGGMADWGPQAPDTNYPVLRTLRWLVPHLLEPVHARTPIRTVYLELSDEK